MGVSQASISWPADTCVLLVVNDAETRVLLAILVAELTGTVGRTVIHQNHFQILIRLLPDTLERSREIFLAIINIDNDTD